MSYAAALRFPEEAIHQINSLGGPPLPTGVSAARLKVILENRRAAGSPFCTPPILERRARQRNSRSKPDKALSSHISLSCMEFSED